MKLFLSIIFCSFLITSSSLKTELTGSSWVRQSIYTSSIAPDTLLEKTTLNFHENEIIISYQIADKLDSVTYNLETYLESENLFSVRIGKRKKDGFIYGYLGRTKSELSIIPSNFEIILDKNIIDKEATDSKWMVFKKLDE